MIIPTLIITGRRWWHKRKTNMGIKNCSKFQKRVEGVRYPSSLWRTLSMNRSLSCSNTTRSLSMSCLRASAGIFVTSIWLWEDPIDWLSIIRSLSMEVLRHSYVGSLYIAAHASASSSHVRAVEFDDRLGNRSLPPNRFELPEPNMLLPISSFNNPLNNEELQTRWW